MMHKLIAFSINTIKLKLKLNKIKKITLLG